MAPQIAVGLLQARRAGPSGLERKPPLRPTGPVIALWAATKLAHFYNQGGNLWSILVYMLGAFVVGCQYTVCWSTSSWTIWGGGHRFVVGCQYTVCCSTSSWTIWGGGHRFARCPPASPLIWI
jgi:hypothetical protein